MILVTPEELARLVREAVRAEMSEQPGLGVPVYANAANNPLGSRRAFLSAHRRGAFKTFKRGREISAFWKDVESFMLDRAERLVGLDDVAPARTLEEELKAASAPSRRRKSRAA